ncbi:hypothetical protein BTVI_137519 [Pitangus sulphuratus]|nr:hypothetical protein BTVI_137519 [Pitangus sulphuratus]
MSTEGKSNSIVSGDDTYLLSASSEATRKALVIIPEILKNLDPDDINITIYVSFPPAEIFDDVPVARLLSLNQLANLPQSPRTEVNWAQPISAQRPIITCTIFSSTANETAQISGLLDTGADATIIAKKDWLSHWTFDPARISVNGVGGSQSPFQSKQLISISDPDG